MTRIRLIVVFITVAIITFLVPFTPTKKRTTEHHSKIQTIAQDVQLTEKLTLTTIRSALTQLLTSKQLHNNKATTALQQIQTKHPAIVYMEWHHNHTSEASGKLTLALRQAVQAQLTKARNAIIHQRNYESPTILLADNHYTVIAVPDRSQDGIVAVISQALSLTVKQHQHRNLRVVPYPAEGNYKIESVKPNTMQDTTVRTGNDNGNASHYHVNEVVVKFRRPLTTNQWQQVKQATKASTVRKLGYTYVIRSKQLSTEQLMNYFRQKWPIQYVEPHYLYMTNETSFNPFVPNDSLYRQYQWNLPTIETEQGWRVSRGAQNVVIAVLDTGVQLNHPDLRGKLLRGTNLVHAGAPAEDDVGHGTHVTGIIAANVNNNEGVAGLSWYNKVMPVKVLDNSGTGSTYTVAEGIIWATDHGAKVINMSLGNYAKADFLHDAVKYAADHDVVLISASGNDNTNRPGYPAAYPEVLAVASTNEDGTRSSFSNYGDYIDVAAPGASIASTYPGSGYAALSGTSMASPHVAALAGLIRSINPHLTNVQVMNIIRGTALDLGEKGKDRYFGYGQIDVAKALSRTLASVAPCPRPINTQTKP